MNAMKKIYSIIFAAATLFAASSCQEEIVEPDLGTQENESMTITAGFGAETKTVLDGLKTYWTEGDQISVFDSNKKVSDTDEGNNRCFPIDETATDFEDGKAVSATFKYEGEFVWPQNDQPDPLIVALYPYQEDAYCDFFYYDRNYITGLVIPTDQVAKEGGFDANATFALATSKYSEKENLTFTNLYTLLKITLKEEDVEVVKVEVTGGNIAGEAKVQLNLDTTGETPIFNGGTLSATENGTNTVTLTCEDGFEAGKDYYIAIAPVTYSNIKVYLDEVLVKDTTPEGGKILEPNTVYNISNLDDPHTVADGVYLNDEGVYEISKEAGLFWLAEQVKEGNTFDGKTVKLVADIEMTKDWTPIGNNTDGVEMSFRGNFDGKKSDTENYTISNLKVTASEGAGFFGFKWDGDVANVNFDKAVISGNHYAGVIVGWADGANYNYKFSISNCKVTNSKVTLAAELVGEEYDNGDKAGGIVGYAYAINVTGNTVSNTTITGYRDLGGIAGCAINNTGDNEYAVVSDNTVGQDVRIVIDNSQNYKSYTSVAQHNVASYVGRIEDKEGGHANEIEDNTGEATFETPKYPVERNLKFSETSVTVTYGATFTAPDLTGEVSGVTYSSSNTDVATVNSETGEVEIVSPGETTITASAPATDDFLAGSATYTLTVEIAEFQPEEGYIYMRPSDDWKSADARFAAYFYNQTWKDMTLVRGQLDIYQCEIPESETNVIFCRMNPNTEENRWNNDSDTEQTKPLWNQTADLNMLHGRLYTISGWDNGKWSGEPAVVPVDASKLVVGFSGEFAGVGQWDEPAGGRKAEFKNVDYTDESIYAGTYTFEIADFVLAANDKFKVRINGDWLGSGTNISGISLASPDSDDNFVVSGAGTYDVTVKFSWDGRNYSNVNVVFAKQGLTEPEQEVRIYLHKNWNWDDIRIWCWVMDTEPNIFSDSWPGTSPHGTETIDDKTYLYWIIPETYVGKTVGLLINGLDWGSRKQTSNVEDVILNEDHCFMFEWTSEKGDHLVQTTK